MAARSTPNCGQCPARTQSPQWGDTGLLLPNQSGYTVFGQLYGQVHLPMDNVVTAGRHIYDTPFLAAQDTSAKFIGLNENSYSTRLSALDQMAAVTRAALYQAPQDPVLNQAYLSVQGAREATLKQLNQVMPATSRLRAW